MQVVPLMQFAMGHPLKLLVLEKTTNLHASLVVLDRYIYIYIYITFLLTLNKINLNDCSIIRGECETYSEGTNMS